MRILPAFTLLLLLALMLTVTCIKTNKCVMAKGKFQATSKPDLKSILPSDVKPILDIMRTYGEAERDKSNQNTGLKVNQYLVVTVISSNEMRDAENWNKAFPASFTKDDGDHKWRVVFLLNKRGHNLLFYNPTRELHGEVHAIDLGPLQRLMENFKVDKGNDEYPLVVMYSHFIPCAKIKKLGYSCAEEIGNYAKGRMDKFGMLVGYTTFFKGTDVQSSLDFMRDGGVIAFKAMIDASYQQTVKLQVYPPTSVDGNDTTFQQEYFDCVMHLPASKCCTTVTKGRQENREKIVTFFINDAMYNCTSGSNAVQGLTEKNRAELTTCMEKQIDQSISDKCSQCSTNDPKAVSATKSLFKFCFYNSVHVTCDLGKPKDPNDMYLPKWEVSNGQWNKIYPEAPKDKLHRRGKVMCANPILDIGTMCTRTKDTGSKKQRKLVNSMQKHEKYPHFL